MFAHIVTREKIDVPLVMHGVYWVYSGRMPHNQDMDQDH
jgi:hypothetical protein